MPGMLCLRHGPYPPVSPQESHPRSPAQGDNSPQAPVAQFYAAISCVSPAMPELPGINQEASIVGCTCLLGFGSDSNAGNAMPSGELLESRSEQQALGKILSLAGADPARTDPGLPAAPARPLQSIALGFDHQRRGLLHSAAFGQDQPCPAEHTSPPHGGGLLFFGHRSTGILTHVVHVAGWGGLPSPRQTRRGRNGMPRPQEPSCSVTQDSGVHSHRRLHMPPPCRHGAYPSPPRTTKRSLNLSGPKLSGMMLSPRQLHPEVPCVLLHCQQRCSDHLGPRKDDHSQKALLQAPLQAYSRRPPCGSADRPPPPSNEACFVRLPCTAASQASQSCAPFSPAPPAA
mmetsp:Transcript_64542/g.154179  ORF Transcript_64542/g.154179 Transcript_64542/m.154179 type:complete len:344 (-) Transcript_64542:1049-2080(-)